MRERLVDVVVGAHLEAEQLVDLLVLGGQEDHGHVGLLAQPAQQLHAVHARHLDVEDGEVGGLLGQRLERGGARRVGAHLVAFRLQRHAERGQDIALVIDQNDRTFLFHGLGIPRPCPRSHALYGFAVHKLWRICRVRAYCDPNGPTPQHHRISHACRCNPVRPAGARPPSRPRHRASLIRTALKASLATLDRATGHPYASLILVATEPDGAPVFLISRLALHTRNLEKDPRASLLIDGTGGLGDPLTGGRLTLMGEARPSASPTALRRFLARHPSAEGYAGFADFSIYALEVASGHYIGGFGRIVDLAAGGAADRHGRCRAR